VLPSNADQPLVDPEEQGNAPGWVLLLVGLGEKLISIGAWVLRVILDGLGLSL
jgi:hypothetical protein